MLIYEKKVNSERHIFGTTANVPSESDNQLEYYDLNSITEKIEPTLNDTYLDNGHGGIIQKSTGIQILSSFTDSEGNNVIVVPQVKSGEIAFIYGQVDTSYEVGQEFYLEDLTVYATKGDGSQEEITDYTTSLEDGHVMTLEDTELEVMWNGYYTIVPLTVLTVESIEWTTAPTTTTYSDGGTLDLTGAVVTATYNDESELDVTSECTFSPEDGATLTTTDTKVTASYTYGGKTVTADQAITVS